MQRVRKVSTSIIARRCRYLAGVRGLVNYSTGLATVLDEKRSRALKGGGDKRIEKQHKTVK